MTQKYRSNRVKLAAVGGLTLMLVACDNSPGTSTHAAGPKVELVSPASGSNQVARDSHITARFSNDILNTSVDETTFTVKDSDDVSLSGEVSFDALSQTATFTPEETLPLLRELTATLGTGMTDLLGNPMAAPFTWSFTTADGSWRTTAAIQAEEPVVIVKPQVAINAQGDAFVVWSQHDNATESIWANHYIVGTGWGTAERIETSDDRASTPKIALDDNGNAMAAWIAFDGNRGNVWANRFDKDAGWGTAELIESNNADSDSLSVAVDKRGSAIVVWSQRGVRYDIWANRYAIGSGWGAAQAIEFYDGGDAKDPQIAIDLNGNATVVWWQTENSGQLSRIWTVRYTTDIGWGVAETVGDYTDDYYYSAFPQVSVDSNGNAIAVWPQTGDTMDIWASHYIDGEGWENAERIDSGDGNAALPRVTVDSGGNALAVWQQLDGSRYDIWANRFVVGEGWGTAALIEDDNANDATAPRVSSDANGNALAVWNSHRNGGEPFAARYASEGGWSAPTQLDEAHDDPNPEVATSPFGSSIVVWDSYSGGQRRVASKTFD